MKKPYGLWCLTAVLVSFIAAGPMRAAIQEPDPSGTPEDTPAPPGGGKSQSFESNAMDEFDSDCQRRWAVRQGETWCVVFGHDHDETKGEYLYLGQPVPEVKERFGKLHGQWLSNEAHESGWRKKNRGGKRWWTLSVSRDYSGVPKRTKATQILVDGTGDKAVVTAINKRAPLVEGTDFEKHWKPYVGVLEEQWGTPKLRHVTLAETRYYELFGFKGRPEKWSATEWEDPACDIVVTAFARLGWTTFGLDIVPRIAIYSTADAGEEAE